MAQCGSASGSVTGCLDMVADVSDTARFQISGGRVGEILYEEDGRTLRFWWEASASPNVDTLLAPVDLRHGVTGEAVPLVKQLEILGRLRDWLSSTRIRTDLDRPSSIAAARSCVWIGCKNVQLEGIAYCSEHFDLTLLRRD